ncbi:MotA/TolQ/ExbB proton channel family protein [Parabacteroides sp. Marseille-P3160]|uniref:MotA/TolQ/ExbB proton channel family protein n=1 Tax=Parabacteroides sp. Marseille-P3160 TaxID=1917887 RepID=UPI0009BBE6D4|nr:MotA/TolQ/ExbB proton channel family protein [Parabacteroides sp. Marseille-P3160]
MLLILLQAVSAELTPPAATEPVVTQSYFDLLLKGGWILLPLFLLSLLSLYVIIDRCLVLKRLGSKDPVWFSRVWELVQEQKPEKAVKFCHGRSNASAKVVAAGLKEYKSDDQAIQDAMQIEARQQISIMESQMNYLGITASIAPMLGFLGTIFGVITIFYNISITNDLSIASISDGLYQKMICSGAGLFVGIIAYTGYYLLNSRIDRIVLGIDKDSNEILKAIRSIKRGEIAEVEAEED